MLALGALGLWTISRRPFWYDESYSIWAARGSFENLLHSMRSDHLNEAFYYLVLHFWRLLGESELRLRAFSVLCAVATVPALYLLGRQLLGRRAALAACIVFATNAFVVAYSQEVRGYTLLLLLLVVATLLYLRAMERSSWSTWTLYGIVMAAALMTQFFAGFVLVAHALGFLTRRPRPRLLPALPGLAIFVAAAVPIGLGIAFGKTTSIVAWMPPTTLAAVWGAVMDVAGGGELRFALIAVLMILGVMAARRWAAGLLLAWVVVPFVGALLISLVQPVFISRYLLLTTPAIALVAGGGLARLRLMPALVAGAAVVLIAIPPLATHYGAPYDDWRGAAAYVATYAQPGDRIVFDHPVGAKPFLIYLERDLHAPLVTVSAQQASPAPRVWLVFWKLGYGETTAVRNGMGKYKAIVNVAFGGVRVQLAVPR